MPTGLTTERPLGVLVADASGTRGQAVVSDAAPQTDKAAIVDAVYQGEFHDLVRDQFAEDLAKAGNTVLKEVPLTLQAIHRSLQLSTLWFAIKRAKSTQLRLKPDLTRSLRRRSEPSILTFS